MKLKAIDNTVYLRAASGLLMGVYYPATGVLEIRRNGDAIEIPLRHLLCLNLDENGKINSAALDALLSK